MQEIIDVGSLFYQTAETDWLMGRLIIEADWILSI